MRLLLVLLLWPTLVFAQLPTGEEAPAPAAELGTGQAIGLGLTEGITEYLPISSTGHLIILTRVLGLDSDAPLQDAAGQTLWQTLPSADDPLGVPLTVRQAADTYVVIIQFGAIAAVALLYWRQILSIARGAIGRDPAGFRLGIQLALAFVPAAVIGLLAHEWIERELFSVAGVIAALVSGSLLMVYAEHWRRRRVAAGYDYRHPEKLTLANAVTIGCWQCLSLWPGMSRSMTCIVGGFFVGLDPRRSAEFSFLLGFVTLTAATAYKSLDTGAAMISVFGWPHVILGAVVATVAAAAAVRFLVAFLNRYGLYWFAIYRLLLAAILAVWYLRPGL